MELQPESNSLKVIKHLFPSLRKLCIVTNCFPPCPPNVTLPFGGIFAKYVQLAEELRCRKQSFITISLYYWIDSEDQNSPNVWRVGKYKPYSISNRKYLFMLFDFFNPILFGKCIRVLKTEKPDVVLIGEMGQMSLSPILAAKTLGLPVIIEHDWICPTYPETTACNITRRLKKCGYCLEKTIGGEQNVIVRLGFGLFSAFMFLVKRRIWNKCVVFAESEYFKKLYEDWGIKSEVIYRVPPTPIVNLSTICDTIFAEELQEKIGESKVIVYVGRLSPEKGITLLVQSYKIIKEETKQKIKLVIAGDGPLKGFVQNESKIDADILYLGWLEKEKLKLVYILADIVAIPSIVAEAYPHVALEALSLKKKVVGFNQGGLVEISKQNPEMILVSQLNSDAYANKIIEILKEQATESTITNNVG